MGNCFSGSQAAPQPATQPSQPAAPQAQDAFSQGVGDAQQVLNLAEGPVLVLINGIYKYVERRALEAKNRRDETNHLNSFIGPWRDEAFKSGACMVPVLDIDNFQKHLQNAQGRLQPRGTSTANSPWANLLHALAINPGDNVLTWKRASGVPWEMPQGELAMDVRGAAFCHLVNLYKIEDPSEELFFAEKKLQERRRCRLSFGWLTWTTSTDVGHMSAKYESDSTEKTDALKVPFETIDPQPLPSQGENLWDAYQKALKQGISDNDLVWLNPNTSPLSERLQSLKRSFHRLSSSQELLIFTKPWLEQATRIRSRATTNGDTDKSFESDVSKTLAQHPRRPLLEKYEYYHLRDVLRECFFHDGDRFSLEQRAIEGDYGGAVSVPLNPHIVAEDVLARTLESYSTASATSWKGQLYKARAEVVAVAMMPRILKVDFKYVRMLDFGPKDALWNARVHL